MVQSCERKYQQEQKINIFVYLKHVLGLIFNYVIQKLASFDESLLRCRSIAWESWSIGDQREKKIVC